MNEPTHVPIPRSEQTGIYPMPIAWRCYCGAPTFGVYDLATGPSEDLRRVVAEHRAQHRKEVK